MGGALVGPAWSFSAWVVCLWGLPGQCLQGWHCQLGGGAHAPCPGRQQAMAAVPGPESVAVTNESELPVAAASDAHSASACLAEGGTTTKVAWQEKFAQDC